MQVVELANDRLSEGGLSGWAVKGIASAEKLRISDSRKRKLGNCSVANEDFDGGDGDDF